MVAGWLLGACCLSHAQQPVVVTSICLDQATGVHHNRSIGQVVSGWFGPPVKAVALADGGSVTMYRYTAGPDTGVQVIRHSPSGQLVWNYAYTDPGVPYIEPGTICLANDQGYIIAGQTAGYTNDWDPFLLKLDADGNIEWFRTYSCSRNLFVSDVSQGLNGNICMVGSDYFLYTSFWPSPWTTPFTASKNAAAVMITDALGSPISFKPYSFHFGGVDRKWEHFADVEPLAGGGFLVAGNSGHNWDFFAATLLRLDDMGNDQWCRHWICTQFAGTWRSDLATAVVQDSPTSAIAAGYVSDHDQYSSSWNYHDAFAMRIDLATGLPGWSKRYLSGDAGITDAVMANGHVLLTGNKFTVGSPSLSGGLLYDLDLATGAPNALRTYHYDPSPGALFTSIDAFDDGDLLMAGSTMRNGAQQALMARTDPGGGGACIDSVWATPNAIDLTWTERTMLINAATGLNPSASTTIPTQAVDRSWQRSCVCQPTSTFCPVETDTLFTLDKDSLTCPGDSLHMQGLLAVPAPCGEGILQQHWQYYADGAVVNGLVVGGTPMGSDTGSVPAPLLAPDGATSIQVRLSIINCTGDTLCDVAATVGVDISWVEDEVLGPDTSICATTLLLQAPPGGSSTAYAWYAAPLGGSLAQAQALGVVGTAQLYTADSSGTYFLIHELNGCTAMDSIAVVITPLVIDLPDSAYFCAGDSVLLDATWPGATGYAWSGVATGTEALATVSAPGDAIMAVIVGDCPATDTIAVVERPLPALELPMEQLLCIDTRSALLTIAQPHDSVIWSTGSHTSSVTVYEPGTYSASIADHGCWSLPDSIRLHWGDCACVVHVPNSFTPNGDELNETWGAIVDCPLGSMELLVFNRWGMRIATLTNPAQTWDGTFGGAPCPIGVYAYLLRYAPANPTHGGEDTGTKVYGHVTLLR